MRIPESKVKLNLPVFFLSALEVAVMVTITLGSLVWSGKTFGAVNVALEATVVLVFGGDRGAGVLDVGESPDGGIAAGGLGSIAGQRSRRRGAGNGGRGIWSGGIGAVERCRHVGRAGDRGGDCLRLRRHHHGKLARDRNSYLIGSAAAAAPAAPKADEGRRQRNVSRTPMPLHAHCLPHTCALCECFVSAALLNSQVFLKITIILTP